MDILRILARTVILFICSVIQVIGVLVEGACGILLKTAEYLVILDDKLEERVVKKTEKTEAVDDGTTDPGTDAAEDGGCRGMIALPAVIATSGLAVVGFSKKRGEKKKKDKK
jgi:hypothetical protein